MADRTRRGNSVIILFSLAFQFGLTVLESVVVFFRSLVLGHRTVVRENRFLDVMHFVFHAGPKKFWRKPTGIKAGRSVATLIRYAFYREASFTPDDTAGDAKAK